MLIKASFDVFTVMQRRGFQVFQQAFCSVMYGCNLASVVDPAQLPSYPSCKELNSSPLGLVTLKQCCGLWQTCHTVILIS